jgi:hypothetical protein
MKWRLKEQPKESTKYSECFEKISNIRQPCGTNQKKERKMRINETRGKKEAITMDTNGIQRIIKEYFKNLYSNILENLEEMDKFLGIYDLPKIYTKSM